jgi:hypothetical protein
MFGYKHNLYFFDQESRIRARRERKPVDQLPFNLPYTGVSGTLKVEAYLRQQIKISAAAGDSSPQTPDTNNEDKAVDVQNNKTKDVSLPQESEQAVSKTTRRAKLFATLSDYNEADEEEDTQRFLFEENKFAAPNLLAHLGRTLEILYETQVDQNTVSARGRTFDNWANLTTSNNRYLDVSTSNFNLHAIGISIPFHLAEKLKWNFEQLIVNTVYTKRQWQTTGYKQQATAQSVSEANSQQQAMSELREESKSGGDVDNSENDGKISRGKRDSFSKKSKKTTEDAKTLENSEASHNTPKRGSFSGAFKKSQKSTDEPPQKPLINVEVVTDNKQENTSSPIKMSQDSLGDLLLKPSVSVVALADVLKQDSTSNMKDKEIKIGELPNSVQGFRRESVRCVNVAKTPRTRLEKYKYIPDKSSLCMFLSSLNYCNQQTD